MKRILISVIRFYKKWISPAFPSSCRYRPTCSVYAQDAISSFGAAHGGFLAAKRILRCHPGHPGGWDPVPKE